MPNKENIEKLSELREQALKLIEQYNQIAETENYETRIGVIDASYEVYDRKYEMAMDTLDTEANPDIEPSQELIDSMVIDIKSEMKHESPYWSTEFPGVKGYSWKPSGINC